MGTCLRSQSIAAWKGDFLPYPSPELENNGRLFPVYESVLGRLPALCVCVVGGLDSSRQAWREGAQRGDLGNGPAASGP